MTDQSNTRDRRIQTLRSAAKHVEATTRELWLAVDDAGLDIDELPDPLTSAKVQEALDAQRIAEKQLQGALKGLRPKLALAAMDERLLRQFQLYVSEQCNTARLAAITVDRAMHERDDNGFLNQDVIWVGISSFLTATANVSKTLWNDSARFDRLPLRESLEVDDSSPLRPRDLRNHLEHFDQHLEAWGRRSQRRVFISQTIAPDDHFRNEDPGDVFLHFGTPSYDFYFSGKRYYVQPVITELGRVQARAMQVLRAPGA